MKYVVIGLGNFGSVLCESLSSMGHEVVGVDCDMEKVETFKKSIHNVVCLDARSVAALNTLPVKEADAVFVTIGENFGASVMVIAQLKQMHVKRLVGRSMSNLHRAVIEAIGVDEIISPESDFAHTYALCTNLPGTTQSFPIGDEYCMVELKVPYILIGQSISSVDFKGRFGVQLIAIRRFKTEKNIFGTPVEKPYMVEDILPDMRIDAGDFLLLFGKITMMHKLSVL